MKSVINNLNSHKIPFVVILMLFFVYICPNTRYPSVGENSFLSFFIFFLGFSFFKYKEIIVYLFFGILCLIFPVISAFTIQDYSDLAFVSSAMSFYIMTVPILSSITLGRIIGSRYFKLSRKKTNSEFQLASILLAFLFFLSAFLKEVSPSILYFFLHAGRTSHNRIAFFFTEPSQSASIFITLLSVSFFLLTKNKFSKIIGNSSKRDGIIILFATLFLCYLAQPLTLFAQLILIFSIIFFLIIFELIKKLFLKNVIDLKVIGLRKSKYQFLKIIPISLILILSAYYTLTSLFERVIGLITFVQREGYFLGIMISGGNRFYYAFTSFIEGLNNPFSLPGDWVGKFSDSLVNVLDNYSLTPPDAYGLLQLYKTNPLVLKPSGWLFFGIYDLGILGFTILSILMLSRYIKWTLKGILKFNIAAIIFFSTQISLLVIPLLPSTPSAFFPLLIVSSIIKYKEEEEIYEKSII